jgi:asparagine synthase (glutamine-hydrolysing)
MCGICGVVSLGSGQPPVSRSVLEGMNQTLTHRGPDDAGYFIDPRHSAGLAMRRLSIIDLATGHQPITNEDGTVWIVFNGEIYNQPGPRVRQSSGYGSHSARV